MAALVDMLEAVDHVDEMLAGLSRQAFEEDRTTQRAVERCLEIVSEASRRLTAEQRRQDPDVPWRSMADMGNVLRHEYHRVAASVVWSTARSLGDLRPVLLRLIADARGARPTAP